MATPLAAVCPGCFRHKGGEVAVCPHCGYDAAAARSPLLLPVLTRLNQRYLIGRTLGKPGGFGVTYLGLDLTLQVKVAIKEYCPRDLVGRDTSRRTLAPHSQEDGELFQVGLQAFLDEARTLAKFDHANVVRVRDFFEANGTAYLVMDYYDGESLLEYLERHGGKLPWRTALELMLPVLDGLREVHQRGFLHRDVKPHNIYLTTQGRPILLDFGSARQAMGERSRSLSVMLTEGYAPFEQYTRRGGQGPWTDIYGAAATLYLLVTGQTPPPATERVRQDELIAPQQWVPDLPQPLNAAILYGLATDPQQRPQTMEQFEQWLHGMVEGKEQPKNTLVQSNMPVTPKIREKIESKCDEREESKILRLDLEAIKSIFLEKNGLIAVASFVGLVGVFLLIIQIKNKPINPQKSVAESTQLIQEPQTIEVEISEVEKHQWINKAKAYYSGQDIQQDYKQAFLWFKKAADQNAAEAQAWLGVMYMEGQGVTKNEIEASRWVYKSAQQGYAPSQNMLGNMYFEGRGLPRNYDEAFTWFRKAAEQGHIEAQGNLGAMYLLGRGIQKNPVEAAKWVRMAAEKGYVISQNMFGNMYFEGQGVSQNDTEAARWYKSAAEQGVADAQGSLATMYLLGRGVPQNDVEAANWYRKSAEQGLAEAQNMLGNMYFNGRGVQQSNSEAMNWYRKAAGQGSANAEFSIGMMYYQGKGVEKNDFEAIRWYQEAAKKGHDEAKKMLIEIQKYHEKIQQNDEQIKRKNMEEERKLISKNKQYKGDLMSANFEDIEIRAFLMILADFTGLNIVVSNRVRGTINLHFQNEPWDKVLDYILETNGLSAKAVGNNLYIGLHSEF